MPACIPLQQVCDCYNTTAGRHFCSFFGRAAPCFIRYVIFILLNSFNCKQ